MKIVVHFEVLEHKFACFIVDFSLLNISKIWKDQMKEITNDPNFFFLQILLSASIGPILLYRTLGCWVYPMRDYIGGTGCHMIVHLWGAVWFSVQLQSFFTSIFRYICVFHNGSILNLNLSPCVSSLAVMILFSVSSYIHFQMKKGHFFCIK